MASTAVDPTSPLASKKAKGAGAVSSSQDSVETNGYTSGYTHDNDTSDEHSSVGSSPNSSIHSSPEGTRQRRKNGAANGNLNGHTHGDVAPPLPSPEPSRNVRFTPGTHRIHSNGQHENEASRIGRTTPKTRVLSWGNKDNGTKYPRLSKPLELMRSSYDCVVIGSGYGGGVAASRMARAGQSVCVLERGKERWPGEFPSESGEALSQLHFSGEFSQGWLPNKMVDGGDPTGLYHMIFGAGQNAVVANGQPP